MTILCGGLLVANGSMPALRGGPMLGPSEVLAAGPAEAGGFAGAFAGVFAGVFQFSDDVYPAAWKAIVIHHSGTAAGDADQIDRRHRNWGLDGLGYHFVIGNGSGMDDGAVHLGYRWREQVSGQHVIGPDRDRFNAEAIGICLIGNGNARPFTPAQMQMLRDLVRQLQIQYQIPAKDVTLHRDLSAEVTSPGVYFADAEFRAGLASIVSH